jgi:hypothetical protein
LPGTEVRENFAVSFLFSFIYNQKTWSIEPLYSTKKEPSPAAVQFAERAASMIDHRLTVLKKRKVPGFDGVDHQNDAAKPRLDIEIQEFYVDGKTPRFYVREGTHSPNWRTRGFFSNKKYQPVLDAWLASPAGAEAAKQLNKLETAKNKKLMQRFEKQQKKGTPDSDAEDQEDENKPDSDAEGQENEEPNVPVKKAKSKKTKSPKPRPKSKKVQKK